MYPDIPNSVFSLFSFIGFILALIPIPWHLQGAQITNSVLRQRHTRTHTTRILAWNTGTCLFMAWTGLGCLNYFINSIIWNGNTVNWAPVWCDICKPRKFTITHGPNTIHSNPFRDRCLCGHPHRLGLHHSSPLPDRIHRVGDDQTRQAAGAIDRSSYRPRHPPLTNDTRNRHPGTQIRYLRRCRLHARVLRYMGLYRPRRLLANRHRPSLSGLRIHGHSHPTTKRA